MSYHNHLESYFKTENFHAAVKVVHTACGFLCFVTQNFHLEIYATLF